MRLTAAELQAMIRKGKRPIARGRQRLDQGEANKTEAQYLAFLEMRLRAGEIIWYKFKPFSFKMAKNLHYNPDVAWVDAKTLELVIDDVKAGVRDKKVSTVNPNGDRIVALVEDDALVKMKAIAELFPFRFRMVWPIAGGTAWQVREFGGESATQETGQCK